MACLSKESRYLRKETCVHNEKLEEQQEMIKALVKGNKKLIDKRMRDDLE